MLIAASKTSVHSVVQMFIDLHPGFTRFFVRSFVYAGGRSLDRLIIWFVRLFVVCAFVCVSALFSCSSVCPVLLERRGRSPRCSGLSLSLISSVSFTFMMRGMVGWVRYGRDSGCQWRLYMPKSDLTSPKRL